MSTKLGAVAVDSYKRLEELAILRGAHDRVESLVRSIAGQSVEALGLFINQSRASLVDFSVIGLKDKYAESQVACHYTLTHVSVVCATISKVQSPAPPCWGDGNSADTNPSTPASPKPSTSSAKECHCRSKKARRKCFTYCLMFHSSHR